MKPPVLVLDDSLTVRMDLTESLEAAGFEPTACATVAAAREALARTSFGLAVLDVLLPDGDGVELLREIKSAAATADTRVILLSTEAEVRDRVHGLRTGADEYIAKPYELTYLIARARELVHRGAPGASHARPTVLLIDDSATYREAIRGVLEAAGYTVATAATGEEGLRAAFDLRPRAVIVDGVMPGLDGAAVIRRIRQDAALRRTPCLLLTASDDGGDELSALETGADAFVLKRAGPEILLARLSALLRSGGAPPTHEPTPSTLGPKRILAVDDSMTYLEALGPELRGGGYDVAFARSGEEAIELLAVQRVDCILLDLSMPGLSGHETCRRIKGVATLRDIPLMMLTAREDRETMIESINAGADDYIPKSADFEVLRARLRAQLRRKQFEDENREIRDRLVVTEMEAVEARAAQALAQTRAALLTDLERKNAELASVNHELEAFSYSVSHDLRAPLRAILGFSEILGSDHAGALDEDGKACVLSIRSAANRMSELIQDMLRLSKVTRADMLRQAVDLSAMGRAVARELRAGDPARLADVEIQDGLLADGDARLLRAMLENLLGNAWKFTRGRARARIELGATDEEGGRVFFVRDDGAGFDEAHADRLFRPFQRLHDVEFEGTGIGLATVKRIVDRHGGRVWAEARVGQGATFYFTL